MLLAALSFVLQHDLLASVRIGRVDWSVWSVPVEEGIGAVVVKNGEVVRSVFAAVDLYKAKVIKWPYPGTLLLIASHSGVGHGEKDSYFLIRNGQLRGPILDFGGERGGPVFLDVDGDKEPEMLFDNYDYYTHGTDVPDKYITFKIGKDGNANQFRVLPNKWRKHLPKALTF